MNWLFFLLIQLIETGQFISFKHTRLVGQARVEQGPARSGPFRKHLVWAPLEARCQATSLERGVCHEVFQSRICYYTKLSANFGHMRVLYQIKSLKNSITHQTCETHVTIIPDTVPQFCRQINFSPDINNYGLISVTFFQWKRGCCKSPWEAEAVAMRPCWLKTRAEISDVIYAKAVSTNADIVHVLRSVCYRRCWSTVSNAVLTSKTLSNLTDPKSMASRRS